MSNTKTTKVPSHITVASFIKSNIEQRIRTRQKYGFVSSEEFLKYLKRRESRKTTTKVTSNSGTKTNVKLNNYFRNNW